MKYSKVFREKKEFVQLTDIFHDAVIRYIDLTHWHRQVSFIVQCNEYLGSDYPHQSVFYISFTKVRHFSFDVDAWPNKDEHYQKCAFRIGNVHDLSKESMGNEKFYRLIFKTGITVPKLEIHFSDIDIKYIGDNYGSGLLGEENVLLPENYALNLLNNTLGQEF